MRGAISSSDLQLNDNGVNTGWWVRAQSSEILENKTEVVVDGIRLFPRRALVAQSLWILLRGGSMEPLPER